MIVKDVMNSQVETIKAEQSAKDAAIKMVEKGIGSLIVVDGSKLEGIVTRDDIMHKIIAAGKAPAAIKVKNIMTKNVIMVSPMDELDYIVDVMKTKKIKKLPVVEGDQLIGIVTSTDICNAEPNMLKELSEILLLPREKKVVAG
ncbi:MAG: CBS domain-containing protein [Candidatus Aenigmatarchaeota archaeon]